MKIKEVIKKMENLQDLTKRTTTMKHFKEEDRPTCKKHDMPILFKNFANNQDYCVCCKLRDEFLISIEELKTKRTLDELEKENTIKRLLERANIPQRFKKSDFDNFEIKDDKQNEKRECVLELKKFINNPCIVGLILIGRTGTGKNHLAVATVKALIKRYMQPAMITKASKMIREFKDNWITKKATEESIINKYVSPFLLVVNEIGVQFGSETEQQYFTEIIDDRYEAIRPTILIGNITIKEIENLIGSRIVDRFKEGGEVLVFDWESYRGKKRT